MINSLSHISLSSRDLKKVKRFYVDLLKLELPKKELPKKELPKKNIKNK